MLRSCGATDMELAANQSSKTMSKSGAIQAFIKDIFCLVREATAPCDILLIPIFYCRTASGP